MSFETLDTERLSLIKLTPESFEDLFQHHSEEYIVRFLGLADHDEYIREKEKSEGGYRTYDRTIAAFLMVLKTSGNTIGRCGFHNWYPVHKKAELGYVLFDEQHRGRGYMTEAIAAILDHGFTVMDLLRVEACTSPNNQASIHLIEKFGFQKEGYLRQHFFRDGKHEDSLIYSLLKSEFESK